jgi:hypothetical protein
LHRLNENKNHHYGHQMKVVILSTYQNYGGAAIAAQRLHKALQKSGIDSTMLVGTESNESQKKSLF